MNLLIYTAEIDANKKAALYFEPKLDSVCFIQKSKICLYVFIYVFCIQMRMLFVHTVKA